MLVRDELEVPIVVIAERRQIVGGGCKKADRVVGQRRGRPVGVIRVVGEDDLGDFGHLPAERLREPAVHSLRELGELLGDRLEASVIVNVKVRRLERPPLEIRIACRSCRRTQPGVSEKEDDE